MAMPRKLTGSKKVVALCDPALANFPISKTKIVDGIEVPDIGLKYYSATLDLDYLGDLSKLPNGGPTIFEVMPISSRHMSWDRGDDTDWALVFQFYCVGIENGGEFIWETNPGIERKTLTDKSMELLPFSFVKDVAHKILQLAKYDGATIPFTMLDSSLDALRRCRGVKFLNMSHASTESAKASD